MTSLYRVSALDPRAAPDARGGALWFPRELQGGGRHDNPDHFGVLYASAEPVAAVVEQLAQFRGSTITDEHLMRFGRRLALAVVLLGDEAALLDLDDPSVLVSHTLRPSQVATRHRAVTQAQALDLWRRHGATAGLAWWSTFEASFVNVTLFDRAAPYLEVQEIRPLTLTAAVVGEAAELLGLVRGRPKLRATRR